jgi:predicted nucleic acid-binding protein
VCAIVPQVVYEFWVVATRPREQNGLGLSIADADAAVEERTGVFRLLLDERGVFIRWKELVRRHEVRGKLAHDARLVAAMQRHGIESILTFNAADFQRFTSIKVITPTDVSVRAD